MNEAEIWKKEGGNTLVQCYANRINQTFYSPSSKGGLHSNLKPSVPSAEVLSEHEHTQPAGA